MERPLSRAVGRLREARRSRCAPEDGTRDPLGARLWPNRRAVGSSLRSRERLWASSVRRRSYFLDMTRMI